MRTLPSKYLSDFAITKETYEIDLAVLDRYQSFAAELLRIALSGLAGYGFLIANVVFKGGPESAGLFDAFHSARYVLAIGVLALALSAACALGHRYFSTDSITHYVRRLRLQKRAAELPESDDRSSLERIIAHESTSLHRDLNRCRWLLLGSSILLLVGAASVAYSFAVTLFAREPQV